MNLYVLKHTQDETELFMLEKKCLFNIMSDEKCFFIEDYIEVDRSPFVKYCIKNVVLSDSLENLIELIKTENISFDNFKIKFLDIEGGTEFNRRHEIEGIIGYEINGLARVDAPDIIIGVTVYKGNWIMGEYIKNKSIWLEHNDRPQEYCNALTTRVSRAIVNIAVGKNMELKLIDPCCGIGTVVMEALSMGLDIVGSDINEKVIQGAIKNLEYFEYKKVVKVQSIHDIKEHYDVVIVDLPYGILSIANKLSRLELVKSAKKIGNKLLLIALEDIDKELLEIGFKLIDKCMIAKGKFKRRLYVLEN